MTNSNDSAPTQPSVDEIADGIYRISTFVPGMTPTGFTFNQFLIRSDEPLLFHTGPRGMFPMVAEAVASILPIESVRYLSFGHVEADECGSMNMWLASAPKSQVAFNGLGCEVSLNDMCDRSPRALADGEVLDLGRHRVRVLATPHLPHGWEAQVLFEERTKTLLCGDLFTHVGRGPALTSADVVGPALEAEDMFHGTSMTPATGAILRRLAELAPTTLAIMHGSSYSGDGGRALHALADGYAARMTAA